MKIQFFERKTNKGFISIEKLFDKLGVEFEENGHQVYKLKNPFDLKFFFLSWFYFWKNQKEINHITGDIHWVSLVLNPKTTVLTIHDLVGLNYLTGLRKKIYYYFWLYLPIRRLKYITVISEKTKEELLSLFPWAKEKIYVIPNFLTIDIPESTIVKKNEKTQILIIGTNFNKNIKTSFEAIIGKDCVLNIVGKLNKHELNYLQVNKVDFNLFFDIAEAELKRLYQKSDILLFPSLYEGFGLPILEAQAYNCIVVTSNISPMKDVAGNGAILVNPHSVMEIKSALNKVISDDVFREELIKNGRINIERFKLKVVAKQYLELYEEILK